MPARRRHRRPRPAPAPAPFVLDALDLLAPPPGRPDQRPRGTELLDWPTALADLYRHLLLPRVPHDVRITTLGTRVVATHLDGVPILRGEPASVLRARPVLTGHRLDLDAAQVLAYARIHADLAQTLGDGPAVLDPRLDLQLVLAAAGAGFSGADVAVAHRDGTLTADRIDLLAALLGPA